MSSEADFYVKLTFYATTLLAIGTIWLTWITRSKVKSDFDVGKADYMLRINANLQKYEDVRELILSPISNLDQKNIVKIRDYTIEFESIYRHIRSGIFSGEEAYQYFGARFYELMTSEVMKIVYLKDEFRDMSKPLNNFKNIVIKYRVENNLDNSKDWHIAQHHSNNDNKWPFRKNFN